MAVPVYMAGVHFGDLLAVFSYTDGIISASSWSRVSAGMHNWGNSAGQYVRVEQT